MDNHDDVDDGGTWTDWRHSVGYIWPLPPLQVIIIMMIQFDIPGLFGSLWLLDLYSSDDMVLRSMMIQSYDDMKVVKENTFVEDIICTYW